MQTPLRFVMTAARIAHIAMLPRGSTNICDVVLIVPHQSVSTMGRLGVCKFTHAANWVGTIEVPLGANVIPKGAALEYSANISLCILQGPAFCFLNYYMRSFMEERFSSPFFPKQRTHTKPHDAGSAVA